jgi:hypothetical protein
MDYIRLNSSKDRTMQVYQALRKYTTAIKMAVRMIQSNWNQ